MPSITLTLKYDIGKNIISVSTFVSQYLHGISLNDKDGRPYSSYNIKNKIETMTTVIANFLKLKIIEETIIEQQDYIYEEWMNWGHIKLNYKPNEIVAVECFLNNQKVTEFTSSMFTIRGKNIALVPGSHNIVTSVWFNNAGVYPLLQSGVRTVPNFWHITYKTGFKVVPKDIIEAICKMTAISILAVLGDIVLGSGITSESISFDGLSQSISANSGGAYNTRIKQYATELTSDLSRLQGFYRGIIFETL